MHVVTAPPAPFLTCHGRLEVTLLPAATDNLVWALRCTTTGARAVVDGPDAAALLAWTGGEGVETVLITHTHADHVGVAAELQVRGLLREVCGPADVAGDVPGLTRAVDEGDEVRVGAVRGRVLRTDGHVMGHVSYWFGDDDDGALFCGDTLFAGGCGYLFSSRPDVMFATLMRLATLPGGTRVCCAHEYTQDNLRFAWSVEPDNAALAARIRAVWAVRAAGGAAVPSTLEEERATNPFLRPGSPTLRARVAAAMALSADADAAAVFTATRALKNGGAYKAEPDPAV